MSNRDTIVGLVGLSTVVAIVGDTVDDGSPDVRIYAGGVLAGIALLIIDSFAPSVAFGFAVIIAITALLTAGPDVIRRFDPTN